MTRFGRQGLEKRTHSKLKKLSLFGHEINLEPVFKLCKEVKKDNYNWMEILCDFLESDPTEIYTESEEFPKFKGGPIFVALSELLDEADEVKQFSTDLFDVVPISHTKIEIAPDEFIKVPVDGAFLIRFGDEKIAISLQHNIKTFHIYVFAIDSEIVDGFLKRLEDKVETSNFLRGKVIRPDGSFVKLEKDYTWDDIVLDDDLIDDIKLNVENIFEKVKLYKKFGLPTRRGGILYGPPGTGKTQCIKILVNYLSKLGVTCIYVTPDDVINYHRVVTHIFDMAIALAPTLIVFEDFDLFSKDRSVETQLSTLGELLETIDGIESTPEVVTLVTTNRLEMIEGALKDRPGRFDTRFSFELPSHDNVLKLYEMFSPELVNSVNMEIVLKATPEEFSGAHIKEVTIYTTMLAFEEDSFADGDNINITTVLVLKAIDAVKKSNDIIRNRVGFHI